MNASQTLSPLACCTSSSLARETTGSNTADTSAFSFTWAVVVILLFTGATETDIVPQTEIIPLNDTQSDLTLADVVQRIEAHLPGSRKPEGYRLGKLVMELSDRHQISPALILAVVEMESSYRFSVVSKAGAVGLMQLLPSTAKDVASRYKVRTYRSEADLRNPEINLRLGVAYLAHLRRQFGHSLHYLAAYNLGPSALKKRLQAGKYELGALDPYVRNIHGRTRELQGKRTARKFPRFLREEALLAASI